MSLLEVEFLNKYFIKYFKNEILAEQKRLMQAIYEEKRKIAEDRAKLDAELSGYKDKQHKDSLSNINVEAELSVGTRRLNEEKIKLEQLSKELKDKEIALKEERVILEEKKRELDAKTAKLEQMAFAVNQKYSQAEDLFAVSLVEIICIDFLVKVLVFKISNRNLAVKRKIKAEF